MADLPKDPNLTDNSQLSDDLKYYSPSPEQMGAPIPVESILPEASAEIEKTLEKASEVEVPQPPLPPDPAPLEEKAAEITPPPIPQPEAPQPPVVDERPKTKPATHPISTSQPLTAQADKEEEDFIEHVEEVHTIK